MCKLVWVRTSRRRHLCDADIAWACRVLSCHGKMVSVYSLPYWPRFSAPWRFLGHPHGLRQPFPLATERHPVLLSPICTRHLPFSRGSAVCPHNSRPGISVPGRQLSHPESKRQASPSPAASSVLCALGGDGTCLSLGTPHSCSDEGIQPRAALRGLGALPTASPRPPCQTQTSPKPPFCSLSPLSTQLCKSGAFGPRPGCLLGFHPLYPIHQLVLLVLSPKCP